GSGGVPVPGHEGATKSSAAERADRRLYDGAPPVVPHGEIGIACIECHDREGVAVAGLGFAPPSPHSGTPGLSGAANCRQCHVDGSGARSIEPFVANAFAGLRQDLRSGARLSPLAPPVIPHAVFLRGDCLACHAGPAAREEIRTSHPERARCRQCHVEQRVDTVFAP
ncbi:MAG TPA: cytochrome c3 family protein, partial [Thermoanaerobaculia bacterium]